MLCLCLGQVCFRVLQTGKSGICLLYTSDAADE